MMSNEEKRESDDSMRDTVERMKQPNSRKLDFRKEELLITSKNQIQQILERQRNHDEKRRMEEATEQRQQRLEHQRNRDQNRRSEETPEKRQRRLESQSSRVQRRRMEETTEQRQEGLQRRRDHNTLRPTSCGSTYIQKFHDEANSMSTDTA